MDDERPLDQLPEHEDDSDVDATGGGGIMSEGGTAIDRGTGSLSGTAQGRDDEVEDPDRPDDVDTELDISSIGFVPDGDWDAERER